MFESNNNPVGSAGDIANVYGAVPALAVIGVTGVIARPVNNATVATALVATGAGGLTIKLKLELLVALKESVTVTVCTVGQNTIICV